ncbi:hypothetical protein [Bosea sp. (in: a-proteobacteria)]|uniref:hypothetical protein n=1 Tax=Bosea sp. (in: a-proteobacteria) TaxID=1871050 RepID=UPI003B3A78CF
MSFATPPSDGLSIEQRHERELGGKPLSELAKIYGCLWRDTAPITPIGSAARRIAINALSSAECRAGIKWANETFGETTEAEILRMAEEERASPAPSPAEALSSQTSGAEAEDGAPMANTEEPDFLKTLMGAASMAESEARDETDGGKVWTLNFLAGKLRDAAFVITTQRRALAKPASEPAGGGVKSPISTAPKDGTWFVAEQDGEIYPCEWAVEEDGEGGRREGWFDHLNQSFEEPTHWWPAALSSPASSSPAEVSVCYNTGLTCVAGCNGRTCAGANVPLNQWPMPAEAEALPAGVERLGWQFQTKNGRWSTEFSRNKAHLDFAFRNNPNIIALREVLARPAALSDSAPAQEERS